MCKHKNVEVWSVTAYKLPVGYEDYKHRQINEVEQKKRVVDEYIDRVVCQDCGEVVD